MSRFPANILWGASAPPHQTEGNNVNSDGRAREGVIPGMEPSGDGNRRGRPRGRAHVDCRLRSLDGVILSPPRRAFQRRAAGETYSKSYDEVHRALSGVPLTNVVNAPTLATI